MSLLEDVFLQDEAGEAQELERVIEGDEYDERPVNSDDNSEKEDEAEEDKRRVDPNSKPQRVVKNPRFILNPARLTGPRGIQVIPDHFKDFKFKGKGHEKDDLDLVLKKLEHWAYRLYPKFQFEDCLKKIETLGKKRPVMVHLQKIRSDQLLSDETIVQRDSSDDDTPQAPEEDEFDKLLQQQIELARATPAPGSVKKGFGTPVDRSPLTMPKATSSPSISDEQKERIMRNRKLAEERRLARLKQITSQNNSNNQRDVVTENSNSDNENGSVDHGNVTAEHETRIVNTENEIVDHEKEMDDPEKQVDDNENGLAAENGIDDISHVKKHNRSNVIDSDTDDDCDITTVNQSVTVDVHESRILDLDKNNDAFDSLNENNEVEVTNKTNSNVNESKVIEDSNIAIDFEEINKSNNINVETVPDSNMDNTSVGKVVTEDLNTTNVESIKDMDDVMHTMSAEVTKIDEKEIIDAEVRKNENKDKVQNETQMEEDLMDVDFSDNF